MPRLGDVLTDLKTPNIPESLVLQGEHSQLLQLSVEDHAEALFDAFSEDRGGVGWTYLPYGPFESFEDFKSWLSEFEGSKDPYFFVICRAGSEVPLGLASYLRIQPSAFSIEVGHIHFSKKLQRTTIATEAMFLMMKWAFENGYRRYEWKCNSYNERSRRAAQRFGFSYEGIFRQAAVIKGRNRDTAWFSIVDKEWSALKDCYQQFLSSDNFDETGNAIASLSSMTRPLLSTIDDRKDLKDQPSSIRQAPLEGDEAWMRLAFEQAKLAGEQGEIPVGAVIVRDGKVIAVGSNAPITSHDPTAHAEIIALRKASQLEENYRLSGATLYVTIEPCSMCVGAMVHARIDRLVFGAREPKSGAVISQNRLLEHAAMNSKIVYSEGVLQQECSDLMSAFFVERRASKNS